MTIVTFLLSASTLMLALGVLAWLADRNNPEPEPEPDPVRDVCDLEFCDGRASLIYKLSRELGIVTVYPANLPSVCNREAFAIDLDESDLIAMLSDLQAGDATLAELAGS